MGRWGDNPYRGLIHRIGPRFQRPGELKQPIGGGISSQAADVFACAESLFPKVFGRNGGIRCAAVQHVR
jgi:hypothetical protein